MGVCFRASRERMRTPCGVTTFSRLCSTSSAWTANMYLLCTEREIRYNKHEIAVLDKHGQRVVDFQFNKTLQLDWRVLVREDFAHETHIYEGKSELTALGFDFIRSTRVCLGPDHKLFVANCYNPRIEEYQF